jgi:hypothetical protein
MLQNGWIEFHGREAAPPCNVPLQWDIGGGNDIPEADQEGRALHL